MSDDDLIVAEAQGAYDLAEAQAAYVIALDEGATKADALEAACEVYRKRRADLGAEAIRTALVRALDERCGG